MNISKSGIALVCLVGATVPAAIAIAGSPAVTPAKDVVKEFLRMSGGTLLASGPSVAKGYTAYLAERNGTKKMFYRTPDNLIMYGLFYDGSGRNITLEDNQALVAKLPKPAAQAGGGATGGVAKALGIATDQSDKKYTAAEALYIATQAYSITTGPKSGKELFVVFDPNCPHCMSLHDSLQPYMSRLYIHWIPVGVLTENSIAKAAAMIREGSIEMMDNPLLARRKLPAPTAADNERLAKNLAVLVAAGSASVPTIIYGDKHGRPIVFVGQPRRDEFAAIIE